jgi:hypothetical protein
VSVTGKVKFFNDTKGYTNYEAGFQKIYWDEIEDFRNGILYEVRQGGSWDNAQFLRSQAHPPFIAQGNGTFLIKARCQPVAGLIVYSENASAIEISGNQLSLNLLAGFDEKATGWSGTVQNGIGVDGSGDLRLGGAGNILADNPLLQSAVTGAATASGNVLSFAYFLPNVAIGMAVADTSTSSAIPAGAAVQAIDNSGLDYGAVAAAPTSSADYGSVTTAATTDVDDGAVTGAICTVTINPGVSGGGVLSGDTIVFSTPDVLDFGGVITGTPLYYTIPASHIINAGSVVQASVNGSTQIVGVPVGQNILSVADVLGDPDVLGSASTQYVDGWIEIALSQDNGATWAAWQKFVPGVFLASAWDFRLALLSNDPNTIATALAFSFTVQLPSRIDHYQQRSVPSGGLTITFQRDGTATPAPFNGGPGSADLPYVSVSWQPTAGDQYSISGLSLSQLTIRFSNGGSFVERDNVNITVEGF